MFHRCNLCERAYPSQNKLKTHLKSHESNDVEIYTGKYYEDY